MVKGIMTKGNTVDKRVEVRDLQKGDFLVEQCATVVEVETWHIEESPFNEEKYLANVSVEFDWDEPEDEEHEEWIKEEQYNINDQLCGISQDTKFRVRRDDE